MKIEKTSSNRAKITFVISPEEFEHGLEHAFEHIQPNVEVKGFRKGKVTRTVYENKFGVDSLYDDALNHVIQHKFTDALDNKEVIIVGQPKVDLDFKTVKQGQEFTLVLDVPIKPEVVLSNYKNIEVKKEDLTVNDEDVNAEIQNILSEQATLEPKKTNELELGDTAIFDFEGFTAGVPFDGGKAENHQLEIGSNQFIPGFETQMIGMLVGESKDIPVTFPKEYHAEDLAGKEAIFKVLLHEIKVSGKPELTDAFVKSLDRDGITTVLKLKASIKKELTDSKKVNDKNRVLDEVIETISSQAKVDIPSEMIDEEASRLKENVQNQADQNGIELEMFLQFNQMTLEDFDKQVQKDAGVRVLQRLVIEAVGTAEGVLATEEEIAEKYQEIQEMYKDIEIEQIKTYFPSDVISENIIFEKTIEHLYKIVKRI